MDKLGIQNLSNEYQGKKIIVFGLGKAGISSIKILLKAGAEIFASDDNMDVINKCDSQFKDEKNYSSSINYKDGWEGVEFLILSPGIPLTHPKPHEIVKLANKNNCKIICDIELLYQYSPESKFIAITGTNGKSTTTALIGHILESYNLNEVEVGGNIGVPASSLNYLGKDGIYVIEISSYQLDLLDKTKFDISILLNISPDHLDRHGSMEGYIAVKSKIIQHTVEDGVSIIAVDDEYCSNIASDFKKKNESETLGISIAKFLTISGFGIKNSNIEIYENTNTNININENGRILRINNDEYILGHHIFLPGNHNMQNIAAASAVIYSIGYDLNKLPEYISSFAGLEHRLQIVSTLKNITFINDSKATNAVATKFALESYKDIDNKKIIWIAGGVAKDGGIESLSEYFSYIDQVYLFGKAANDFSIILNDTVKYTICDTLTNVFNRLKINENSDYIILFSPACASFDQYKNFEERGEDFCRLVDEYKNNIYERSAI